MTKNELKIFLDEKANSYESPNFINDDPIQIPHRFKKKEDIEISGLLTATISWGNRKTIIKNASYLIELMDDDPYNFIMYHTPKDINSLKSFVHRTFNGIDCCYFIEALKKIYTSNGGLEKAFIVDKKSNDLFLSIHNFRNLFLSFTHEKRTEKHISDPLKGSAAKRLNMYLRWMVRTPEKGVDFGIWKSISPSLLSCPLDVHTGNVGRFLGLLKRKQNDSKALVELDSSLRFFDSIDPVKYDFALFGLGAYEKFI
jgi:uncharacterized protein (TIGR02757 family)